MLSFKTRKNDNDLLSTFDEHINLLYSIARRLTDNHEDTQDLLQDLVVLLHEKHLLFEQVSNKKAYLIKSLNNLYINQWRSNKNKPYNHQTSIDDYTDSFTDSTTHLEDNLHHQSLIEQIKNNLHLLKEEHRNVFVMHDIHGVKLNELVDILETPLGTLKSNLHRARNTIRNTLKLQPF